MTNGEKTVLIVAIIIAALLLFFAFSQSSAVVATPATTTTILPAATSTALPAIVTGGAPVRTSVTSSISAPTQIGAPLAAIEALNYSQMSTDVVYWVDPASGLLIPNSPTLLNGGNALVPLSDPTQISNWYANNPLAVSDMDAAGFNSAPIAG